MTVQYLTFFMAGEEYAVGILQIREILELGPITRIPATPAHVRGVINVRGSVVPVIDLAVKLGLPETQVTRRTCVVIVEVALQGETRVLGVLVDAVHQVIELSAAEIEAPPSFGTQIPASFLLGMARAEPKFVMLLDLDRVLTAAEIEAIEEVQAAEGEEPAAVPWTDGDDAAAPVDAA
jgi:purine-binding chemotaxis protein CheW